MLRPSEGGAVRKHVGSWVRGIATIASAAAVLSACATVVDGRPTLANAPNATITVKGDSGSTFDTTVKNALSDITDFWTSQFPKVSGGKSLQPLKGGLYSVDGLKVAQTQRVEGPAKDEACIQKSPSFIVDNGAFCLLDDSIAWDRAPTHLFGRLADKYGSLMVALIFAHEMGHAISYRLHVFDKDLPTIDTESQADCAAGAWAAEALKGQAAHFRDVTPSMLDSALEGFLDGRDGTPNTPQDASHGNGFDRLSAVADGIDKGVTYCFSDGYFASRTFTERPFRTEAEYQGGDNTPLPQIIDPSANNPFVTDLNRFWTAAAKLIGKTFKPVKIAEATHPKCAPASSPTEFGYCPDDNTVYFNRAFAQSAYNSLPDVKGDPANGNVTLLNNQPGDFALGVLFSIGWGMAVRHQLFSRSLDDKSALIAAVCYTGSYAKDVNVDPGTPGKDITLSPADLDEATSSMLDQVGRDQAFGARGSTGLERIQAFVKGYRGGLSTC
jgi:predicted metalloprotease